MLSAITPQTRIVFVANPNNPTGTLAPREEVIKFVNDVPDDVLLVMDEAYIEFLDDAVDLVSLVRLGARKNLMLMRTFSKIFGLAGLRLGYGIGHPELIAALEKIRQPFNINSSRKPARSPRWTTPSTCAKRARTISPGWNFSDRALPRSETGICSVSTPISFWCASAKDSKFSRRCRSRASSCGRWAAINCRNGSAFPSARRRKMSACLGALKSGSRQEIIV